MNFFVAKFIGRAQGTFYGYESQGFSKCIALRHDVSAPPAGGPGDETTTSHPGQLTIVKHWNVASAQLHKALHTREELKVVLGWTSELPSGKAATWYYYVNLTNARITGISTRSDSSPVSEQSVQAEQTHDTVDVEEITIAYEKAEIWARDDLNWPAIDGQSSTRPTTLPTAEVAPALGAREMAEEPSPQTSSQPAPTYSRIAVGAGNKQSGERLRVSD